MLFKISPEEYKAIVKEMQGYIKEGISPIYRHSSDPAKLVEKGFKTAWDVKPKLNTPIEPIGLYFAKNTREINPLLNPVPPEDFYIPDSLHDVMKKYIMPKASGGYRPGLMSAVIPPDVKTRKFDPEQWNDFLAEFAHDEGLSHLLTRVRGKERLKDWHAIRNETDTDYYSKQLTKRIANEGYDAVEFPDTVASQPHLSQVVLLTRGNTLTKWMQGSLRGAGVLGVAAAPKFFNWEPKEQGVR